MTRAAHRPARPRPPIVRTHEELRARLHQAAGEWESAASQVERGYLVGPPGTAQGVPLGLRMCTDYLLRILDGEV
jgi:hypothetical protein